MAENGHSENGAEKRKAEDGENGDKNGANGAKREKVGGESAAT